jgi:cytochrome c553
MRRISGLLAVLAAAACGAPEEPAVPGPPASGPSPDVVQAVASVPRGDPEAGAQLYETCAVCHGARGAGREDGTFPRLAGQHASVVVEQLLDIREGRRRNPVMQPHVEAGGLQELADVAAYIATLPATGSGGVGDGTQLAVGQQLYARDCARCHGQGGEGDAGQVVPRIAGQHYAYLLRQLRNIAGGRRREAHPEMAAVTRGYSDAELQAVADYVARLGREAPPAS